MLQAQAARWFQFINAEISTPLNNNILNYEFVELHFFEKQEHSMDDNLVVQCRPTVQVDV